LEITREYLETQLADLTRQADQAMTIWHNANGALAAVRHLLEVLEKKTPAQSPVVDVVFPDSLEIAAE